MRFSMSFMGVLLLSTVAAQAAVDKVICVPWQGDINKYHTTVSGHNLEIKGVIKTTDTSRIYYKWVFGDGTESPLARFPESPVVVLPPRPPLERAAPEFLAQAVDRLIQRAVLPTGA